MGIIMGDLQQLLAARAVKRSFPHRCPQVEIPADPSMAPCNYKGMLAGWEDEQLQLACLWCSLPLSPFAQANKNKHVSLTQSQ